MKTKKFFLIACAFVLMLGTLSSAVADEDQTSWLFTQTAAGFTATDNTLTIPYERLIFAFSDRPNRAHAYMTAQEFSSLWATGEDNFGENPPNAVLTWVTDGAVSEAEVALTSAQVDERGRSITYTITLEDGQTLPMSGTQASLFVDGWMPHHDKFCILCAWTPIILP